MRDNICPLLRVRPRLSWRTAFIPMIHWETRLLEGCTLVNPIEPREISDMVTALLRTQSSSGCSQIRNESLGWARKRGAAHPTFPVAWPAARVPKAKLPVVQKAFSARDF